MRIFRGKLMTSDKYDTLEAITRTGKSICCASIVSKHGKWFSVYFVQGTYSRILAMIYE